MPVNGVGYGAVEGELSEFHLDTDLPGAGGANVDRILREGDGVSMSNRKAAVIPGPPEKYVSVEKESHC